MRNTIADRKSRKFHDHLEWSFNDIFQIICNKWGTPEVDLFASWNNRKLDKYASWHSEPESWRIDAFSLIWNNKLYDIFPPFSLISSGAEDQDGPQQHHNIVPMWDTQPWLAAATLATRCYITFPRNPRNLHHPPRTAHSTRRRVHNTANSIPFLRNYLEWYGLDKITKECLMLHAL